MFLLGKSTFVNVWGKPKNLKKNLNGPTKGEPHCYWWTVNCFATFSLKLFQLFTFTTYLHSFVPWFDLLLFIIQTIISTVCKITIFVTMNDIQLTAKNTKKERLKWTMPRSTTACVAFDNLESYEDIVFNGWEQSVKFPSFKNFL